jgi:hypothetical protein
MGSERRDKVNQSLEMTKTPGPGTYASKTFVGEGPKIIIKARNSTSVNSSNAPGPGAYQPNISSVVKKPPSIGLGHERRDNLISRSDNAKVPGNKGPGAYSLQNKANGPKFGFGTGKRVGGRLNEVPGPGAYNISTIVGDLLPHEKSK